ncbi:MAG: CoA transferase [Chloroflexi bacterium]|nr:CoA transferase [Chloroflexota bacterium]
MPKPLAGIRVMDLTQVFAGPTCTRILADLGAEVIRMEAPSRMDITRNLIHADNDGQDVPWERALYFTIRNAGKKEVVIDLNQPRGRELLRGIIAKSDVLAESFTPRVMRAFELDYEHVKQIKPDIVMISLSGYGQDGPLSDWSAYGMGLEPASGVAQLTGYQGGPPLRSGLSFTDPYSGFLGAGAVLAALHYRLRTGRGQYIDLSEQEAAVALTGRALMDYAMNGRLPERIGNRNPDAAPQGCYRCLGEAFGEQSAGDDWIVISVESDAEWVALCQATGHAEWAEDERFADLSGRRQHHDELDSMIEGWTREQDHYEAFHLLQQAGVKAAPVLNGKEALLDPQFKARGQFDIIDQPHIGTRPVQRHLAAKFDEFDASAQGPAPTLGQHNHEVLGGLLGLSDDELAALEEQGVITTKPNLPVPPEIVSQALKLPYDRFLEIGTLRAVDEDYRQQLGLE